MSFHLRLAEGSHSHAHVFYWTRLQVAVKAKASKRQVWTTGASLNTSMRNKIFIANAVAPSLISFKIFSSTQSLHECKVLSPLQGQA